MIEMLLVYLVLFGIGAVKLLPLFLQHRRQLRGWQDAAEVCDLEVLETSVLGPKLTARAGSLTVTFYGPGDSSTRVVIQGPVPPELLTVSIRRESLLRRIPEIEVGHPLFDSTFHIEGPPREVLSLLDTKMRDWMISANKEGRLQISPGMLQADVSDEMVIFLLPLLLDIGRRLAEPADVLRRLTENAQRDPEPGVRLRNLLLLARERPGEPGTVEALRTACSDPSPLVRLRAAQELGAEGRDLLLQLAESLEDDTVSAKAVTILDRELPFERLKAILGRASDTRHLETARACLEALGRSGDTAAAEAPLLEALQSEDASLRVAAANALGQAGSAAAVLPLQEAAGRSWLDQGLRRAANQAIAEIQSRLQGAAPGQLSIADVEAGQLSLAQPEGGQLALAPHEPPQEEPPPGALREPGVREV